MARGIIKSYYEDERFGYIEAADGQSIFFHHSDLEDAVKVGDQVEFDVTQGTHSRQAVYVRKQD